MEIRQLKYFLSVAEALNFSAAGRKLFITQSTLSQQIGRLEQEIGLPLFERNSHEVRLTEAGRELLPHAQKVINAADSCKNHIDDLKQLLTGELNIGVTYSFSTVMSETLIDFMKEYPGVKLNICYDTMEELLRMLKRHELDFVLAFRPIRADKDLESRLIFSNRLAAIVRDGHPLSRKRTVRLADLERYALVLPARGLQARCAFDCLMEGSGSEFRVKVEVNTVSIIFKLLRRTNCISVLAESTVLYEPDLKAVSIAEAANMDGCIHLLKGAYFKKSAREFVRMLSQSAALVRFSLKGLESRDC